MIIDELNNVKSKKKEPKFNKNQKMLRSNDKILEE
jgi:hypothetical protein